MYPPMGKFLAPEFETTSFIFVISVIQATMFFIELIVGQVMYDGAFVVSNNMAGPGGQAMRTCGAKFLPDIKAGQVYRFITPALLHGGILHIFMNGIFQFMLCFRYEKKWGTKRIAFQYFWGAMGATLLSSCTSPYGISV